MTRSFARRRVLRTAAALGGAALLSPLAGPATAAEHAGRRWPETFPLPNGFRPEGITIGTGPYAYVGSIATGSVYRADLATGRGRVVSQGLGAAHPVIGLKIDRRERLLFLCGGVSREIRIADARRGTLLRTFGVGSEGTMVNDVVLTPGAAYFTDSFKPNLYRLPLGPRDEPGDAITTVPLGGDWVQGAALTANGISRTPDGRALLMANQAVGGGSLMRVDPRTGVARRVDLGGTPLPNADGLLLLGRLLHVVQNRLNTIAVVKVNESGTSGRVVARITDPDFKVPTTAAVWRDRIYLPNARFDVAQPTPDTTYDVVAVDRVGR
ncbi:superoxide dismutase [Streptomyces sp. NPDC096193]|uniref:superoxide dismutase n=1 Tax=Streptomyces sp. NPDC096193 TaxID=3155821 RepID=UPI00332DDE1C